MGTFPNSSPDQELSDLLREAKEHEQALQDDLRVRPRRSPRLLEKFTAAAAYSCTTPEGGLEGCQKALAQYANKVKWHVSAQQRLHMFEEESQKLNDFFKRLSPNTKKKYVSWDIQDLLDFEDPDVTLDEKMKIESSYQTDIKSIHNTKETPEPEHLMAVDADLFQPAPTHWKQIMTLPLHLRQHWAKSFKAELNTLLK